LVGIASAIVLTKEENDEAISKKEIAVDEDISWLM
jgi:hypothetical protein